MNKPEEALIRRFIMAGIILGAMSGLGVAWIALFIMGIVDSSVSLVQSALIASLCMFPVGLIPAIMVGGSTGLLCALMTRSLPRLVSQPFAYYVTMIAIGLGAGVLIAGFWLVVTGDSILFLMVVVSLVGPITAGLLARGYLGLLRYGEVVTV